MPRSILAVGCLLLALNLPIQSIAQCACNFTITPGAGATTFDGAANGVKPGDVICLQAGLRGKISFQNLTGSPDRYVTIKNCGGKAEVGGAASNNAISFFGCRYFRLTGTGVSGIDYGIKIIESKPGSQGVVCSGLSSDFEIDHLEIQKAGFAGIMAKTDPSCDGASTRPNFRMTNVSLHDNYFHEITGEGIYLGNSFYTGTSQYCGFMQYSHEVRGVRVYNNIVDGSGWEAIQIGAAVYDVEVYNNRVYNYGTQNKSAQNGGIQLGSGSTGRVYNNFIKNGTGPGFWIQGIGNLYFYNNIVINPGYEAFNVNVRPTPLPTDIVPTGFLGGVYIINNTIVSAAYAALRENINNAPGNIFSNNLIVNSATNWNQLKTYTDWDLKNNLVIPVLADARFVNPGADDYSLQSTSPAVNAGIDVRTYGVTIDHKFAVRPSGGKYDVGAFEFTGSGPQCNAGGDKSITLPSNTITLNGSGSSTNGPITSYVWTKKSGGAASLQNQNTATLTVTGLAEGVYEFQLEVTDLSGQKATSIAKVTVLAPPNQAPTANAGTNRIISLPTNSTTITGSGFDPDGTIASYQWGKLSGPNVTINGGSTATLQLTGLVAGVYEFQLTVTDDDGASGTASVRITVNPAPVNQLPTVSAGNDLTIYLPNNTVNVTAQASDPDGTIKSILWEKRSGGAGTIVNNTNSTATLQNLVAGVYIFRVTVTDNVDATAYDEVQVNVIQANQAPVANAGSDQTISLPQNSVTLTGQGTDPDGSIVNYSWTRISALQANIATPSAALTAVDQLVEGVHRFGLTVTDDDGATGYDEVTITVRAAPPTNTLPSVNAGSDKSIQLPTNSITVPGSASDSDGTISSIQWSKVSGPSATLVDVNSLTLQVTNMVAGTYVFRLTVRDDDNATATDNVQIVVFPAAINQPPVANAGGNKLIFLPINAIQLVGAGSDPDGVVSNVLWVQESGPNTTFSNNGNTLNLTDLIEGIYVFKFVVTDNQGATDSDFATVSVTASNLAPIIEEPVEQTIRLPKTTADIKTVARDPDGAIASYSWTQVSGTAATLTNTATSTLSLSGLNLGDYVFRVAVTDNSGGTTTADYMLTVLAASSNQPPVANAGVDQSVFLPTNNVLLSGSAIDPDGTIVSYAWSVVSGSGTINTPSASQTTISNLAVGIHKFRLTVTDGNGATDTDDVEIIVNPTPANRIPIVSAGGNKNLRLPTNTVTLSGSGSDADGSITSFAWTQISGPPATINSPTNAATSIRGLIEGRYVFRLRATDNKGASAFDEAIVTVLPAGLNLAPTVNAGSNQSLILPTNITNLIGIAGDEDGTIATYRWTKQTGPNATLENSDNPVSTVTGLVAGTYIFRLTVTDNGGASSYDEVQISVGAIGSNIPPVANAGGNQTIVLPTNSINLFGTGTDQDGTVTSYVWIKTSGGPATLSNQNTPVLTVKGLAVGSYIFRLTVVDNNGASNQDFVNVVVNPATINLPPIVEAGMDQTLYVPNNATTLLGDASDKDGEVTELKWTKQSGPAITLGNTATKNLILSSIPQGSYIFRLTATDNGGASAYDEATVIVVSEPANLPPTVSAGGDIQIYLPLDSYIIHGSATDPDGTIKSYTWTKIQGPPVTMVNAETESLVIRDFTAGVYRFRLKVLDNESRGVTDDVVVTVFPATVVRPPVLTVDATREITLPENEIDLIATASDEDGTIASYTWIQTSGPAATLSGVDTEVLHASNLTAGTYIFRITVVDNQGSEASAQVTVKVNPIPPNQPPVVDAGPNQIITIPASASLKGTAADVDGELKTMKWSQLEGPSTSFVLPESLETTTSELTAPGIYVFRLTATDERGDLGFDDITIYAQTKEQTELPEANFLSFTVPKQTSASLIDTTANLVSITANIPDGQFEMVPTFELSKGAIALVNGQVQASQANQQDFSEPLKYVVVASDSVTEKVWTVILEDSGPDVVPGTGAPEYPLYFSPNADGQNDTWAISNFSTLTPCTLEVFARSGQLVFKSTQFENNWDGTSNGRPLVSGDYYYLVSKQGTRIASGSLRIIR